MRDVLLGSTLHDPRGVFLDVLQNSSRKVLEGYRGWVVNVTITTDERVKNALAGLAPMGVFMTETDTNHPIVSDKVENDHLYLLNQASVKAKELGISKVQYTDGDRIITAATHFPEDLKKMAGRASELVGDTRSYINFRRSPKDYFSHHPPLVQTESEFYILYSEAFGIEIDIGSTAHGMSVDLVEEIIHRSPQMETVRFPHPKWLIIAKEMGIPIRSEETQHVLTFETPDQYKKEVKERIDETPALIDFPHTSADPYEKEQQDYMATLGRDSTVSVKEWDLRFNTEKQYLSLLRNHLAIFGFDEEKEKELRDEIDSSLGSIGEQQEAIGGALKQSETEIKTMIEGRVKHLESVFSQKTSNPEGK